MKGIKRVCMVAALLSLSLVILPMTAGASEVAKKNTDGLYLFWDIPFDSTTPEEFQQAAQKQAGMHMTIEAVADDQIVTSQNHETDLFGYPATLAATFRGEDAKLQYIKRYSQLLQILPEYENGITDYGALGLQVYQEMWEKAVLQFGAPDKDYLILQGNGIGLLKPEGPWDSAEMVKILEKEKSNVGIYTHWGNVRLSCLMYLDQRGPAFIEFCYANMEWPVPKTMKEYALAK